jgi:glutamine amidotransferase
VSSDWKHRIAIVDYGMGNLFNVRRACEAVGVPAEVTDRPEAVLKARAVIVPGVGAMPDAMTALARTGLDEALARVADRGTPLLGICLGMQLLMDQGSEFTLHRGLGIIPGSVQRFQGTDGRGAPLKVPHIGWNAIRPPNDETTMWDGTPLVDIPPGDFMYFVHSYYVVPERPNLVAAYARYGTVEFCAAIRYGNVFGCQFHPERSGVRGLSIYRAFAQGTADR